MGSNQAFCRDDDACFFWTAPNQLKNGYMFDKWWLSNGYCWWWLSYGVVHAASIVQTAAQEHMLYAHVFIPKKAKRDEIQHHTAKQGDNHAKEQMLVFSFGERCCALPPMTPLLLRFYTYSTQESGKTTVRTYSRYPKSPIINNKTLNRSKPIRNSKQTLNQP